MNAWVYVLVMALVTFLVRALPLTLIRGRINNRFIRSFLFYIPYVTLSVMTFPAIISASGSALAGAAALIVGIFCAWKGLSLIKVASACCAVVLVFELIRQ
jgi:branched-subunit amino acid transport protein